MISILEVVAGFVALMIAIAVIVVYNSMVVLRNNISAASADIDVLLEKRHDLIGSLVDTVRGYAAYEKGVLTRITQLRTSWSQAEDRDINEKMEASNQISAALKTVFAVSENYPDLKADQTFMELQRQITEIENQIADRREFYNDSVKDFNIMIQQVPYRFLAEALKYQKMTFLQVPDSEKGPVGVAVDA